MVSIDAKKKELVGTFKNGCREYAPGVPERVKVHDLPDKELGKAILHRDRHGTAEALETSDPGRHLWQHRHFDR